MKKFLTRLLIGVIILLAVASVIQLIISYRINGKTTNGADSFHMYMNDADVVFMGSSRASIHFAPKIFDQAVGVKSVNCGVNGHGDLTMQMIRLKDYLRYNKPPRMIIMNCDPALFSTPYNIDSNKSIVLKNSYARYAFLSKPEDEMLMKYFHFNWAEKYIPLYALLKYKCVIDCITMKGGKIFLKDGYQPHLSTLDTSKYKESSDKYVLKNEQDKIQVEKNLEMYDRFCKENNIKLVCVQSPIYKTLYNKEAFALIGEICKNQNIAFIDLCSDSINNDYRNFTDEAHLNVTGVHKMMNVLVSDTVITNFFKTKQ